MRIVVAPQEFKGSLTAIEAARAIAQGVRAALPDADIIEVPMSDGGPGLVDAMLAARGGEGVETDVRDPLMRPVRAAWAILAGDDVGKGVIEMAAASGLILLRPDERDPLGTIRCSRAQVVSDQVGQTASRPRRSSATLRR